MQSIIVNNLNTYVSASCRPYVRTCVHRFRMTTFIIVDRNDTPQEAVLTTNNSRQLKAAAQNAYVLDYVLPSLRTHLRTLWLLDK
jgi:hypothetical protein